MTHPEKPTGQEIKQPSPELPSEVLNIIESNRLKQALILTDKSRQELINDIEKERGTEMFLLLASLYKTLEPQRFEQDIKMSEEDWGDMIDSVENTRSHAKFFIPACACAYRIGGDKMKQEIEILEDDWQQILREVKKTKKYPLDYVRLASQANEIKPEREDEIIIAQSEWQKLKDTLKEEIAKLDDMKLQELVMELRHLKVEK